MRWQGWAQLGWLVSVPGVGWARTCFWTSAGMAGTAGASPWGLRKLFRNLFQAYSHGGRRIPSNKRKQALVGKHFSSFCLGHISWCPVGHDKPRGQARVIVGRAHLGVDAWKRDRRLLPQSFTSRSLSRVLPEMKSAVSLFAFFIFSPSDGGLRWVQSVDQALLVVHTDPLSTALWDQQLYKGFSHLAHRLLGVPSPRWHTRRVWLDQQKSEVNAKNKELRADTRCSLYLDKKTSKIPHGLLSLPWTWAVSSLCSWASLRKCQQLALVPLPVLQLTLRTAEHWRESLGTWERGRPALDAGHPDTSGGLVPGDFEL